MITIPTITTLYTNILNNLKTSLGITATLVKKVFLIPFSGVWAGMLKQVYLYIGQTQANIWVDTCDDATLLRFGYTILGRPPFSTTAAVYRVTVTGTTGASIPAGTIFRSDPTSTNPNMLYIADTGLVMPSPTFNILLRALTGGLTAQLALGDTMTVTAPLPLIDSQVTVYEEFVTPIDAESLTKYRAKVIEKIQLVAGSWSAVDYRLVGTKVSGAKQIYAYTDLLTANTVNDFIEGEIYGTPVSGGVISAVQAATAPNVPLGVHTVNYLACPINIIAIAVHTTGFPAFTSAQQTLVTNALVSFINTVRPFIAACDTVASRNDTISSYSLFPVISAVIPGVPYSGITFTVDTVPATTYTADLGNIPFCNSVTYP